MSDEEHAKFDLWIVEQLTADLAQAREIAHEQREEILALNKMQMNLHQVMDKHAAGVEALREQLALARAELALNAKMLARQCNLARDAEGERDEMKQQLARTEVAADKLRDELNDGYAKLAIAGIAFTDDNSSTWHNLSERIERLLERLLPLDAAEAALNGCGLTCIYSPFSSPADAIKQMVKRLVQLEGGEALQNEYQLRQEATQRLKEVERELKQRQRQIDLLSGAELRAHQAEERAENTEVKLAQALNERDEARDECAFAKQSAQEQSEALAQLVTPELAALLTRVANAWRKSCVETEYEDSEVAHAYAFRIREVLDDSKA